MDFKKIQKLIFVSMLTYSSAVRAETEWVLELEQSLEDRLLVRLEQAQQNVQINIFTSDGCSGGMSEAWAFMARALPGFAERFGARPVWEDCCIAHDRSYWQGETPDGFNKRLQADADLRRCVRDYGPRLAPELATRHGVSVETVISIFNAAGGMMYQAVRAGGKPCSFLPWRWGYGWPQCPVFTRE